MESYTNSRRGNYSSRNGVCVYWSAKRSKSVCVFLPQSQIWEKKIMRKTFWRKIGCNELDGECVHVYGTHTSHIRRAGKPVCVMRKHTAARKRKVNSIFVFSENGKCGWPRHAKQLYYCLECNAVPADLSRRTPDDWGWTKRRKKISNHFMSAVIFENKLICRMYWRGFSIFDASDKIA